MLSVLVCHSYFLRFDEKQRRRAKPYPPLATLQVAALIRDAGHNVTFFDAMLSNGVQDYESTLQAARPDVVVLYEDNYNYLSKMCLGRMRRAGCDMIERAHDAGARIIAAGSDASDAPQRYLSAGADAVLLGEGLAALIGLIDRLNRDPRLPVRQLVAGLPDVASTIDNSIAKPGPIAPLPVARLGGRPAWDLVHMDAYRRIWRDAHGHFSLNMAASRGCSFRCNWCAKPIWGDRYLQRPASDVAAEMLYLKHEYGVDHVWFADDIFGFRADWVQEFGTALAAGGGGVPFMIQSRADLIRPGMAAALQAAGCREAWIGAESGSQRILDAMNKGTRVPDIHSFPRSVFWRRSNITERGCVVRITEYCHYNLTQSVRPCCLAGLIADEVLADFNNSMGQTAHCAMLPHRVTPKIAAIGFVVPDDEVVLRVQVIEQWLRKSWIAIPQNSGMPGSRRPFPTLSK